MGEVYRAKDSKLKRDVAIKVLPESLAKDPDALARFEREAHAVAALNHPNILSIHDFGNEAGISYAVTELLEGETLRAKLDGGPLPARRAVEIGIQIARGLAAAHEKGIVHRDLKPENVYLTSDGRVKILDFGLAKRIERESAETDAPTAGAATEPGTVMGTVGYMSPEQVRGRPLDHRTDIFSFGAILYEMLAGRRAFKGDSHVETMNAILKEEPPELLESGRNVPPALDRIIRHCLEKNPESRFHSAGDVAFDLEALSGSTSASAVGKLAAPRRPTIVRALAAGAAALALLAGGYFAGKGGVPPAPSFQRLTYQPQFMTNARFAPDGRTVVFSAAPEGNRNQLFVKDADSPQPRALSNPDTRLLAVSSKGELAVLTQTRYLYHRIYIGTLARMPIGEAAPRELLKDVTDADWSPDGSNLAIVRRVDGKDRLEWPIGTPLAVTSGYLSDVRIAPDGTRLAFMAHPVDTDNRGHVEIIDRAGKSLAKSPDYGAEEGIAWSRDGKRVWFSSAGEGADLTVHSLSLAGRVRTALAIPQTLIVLDAANDGRLLVSSGTVRASVMVLAPGATSERDLSWLEFSAACVISPDGKTVVFSEESAVSGANYSVYLRKADGSAPVRLGEGASLALSPDGTSVLAAVYSNPLRLMVYPTGAGEARTVSVEGFESINAGQFVRDAQQVFFCGARSGHASRCYVTSVSGGEPRPITPEGTSQGSISLDGASVVAKKGNGGFSIYPVAGGIAREIPEVDPDEQAIWSSDGRSLILYRVSRVPTHVEHLDLATRRRTPLRDIGPADRAGVTTIGPIVFSEDEKSYVYSFERDEGYFFIVDGVR
jgi:Tol biopolymer transport system component